MITLSDIRSVKDEAAHFFTLTFELLCEHLPKTEEVITLTATVSAYHREYEAAHKIELELIGTGKTNVTILPTLTPNHI
jgi:hypothetical protein